MDGVGGKFLFICFNWRVVYIDIGCDMILYNYF